MVAQALVARWELGRAKDRFRGRLVEGRAGAPGVLASAASASAGAPASVGAPRVAVLCPQTYMNDAGRSVGPARGAYKLALERVLVVHDEIDLPFGEVRTRLGGGLAGHNGLKSIKRELGGADFMRVRVGVGRPDSTDPEIVSAYVLGRFRESETQVQELIERACEHVERAVLGEDCDGSELGRLGLES
jgi:PTH1 family peptidyl-tRNA hydrolase